MNNTHFEMGGALGAILLVGGALLTLVTTVFWLVVGWRAMRAHEQIAEYLRSQKQ